MIEELCEYLKRHGVTDNLADNMHDAYYHGGISAVRLLSYPGDLDADDMEKLVRQWGSEVGEW